MMEEREKKLKREITDADVLSGIADTAGRAGEASVRKSKSGIMVKGSMIWRSVFPSAATRCQGMKSWDLSPGAAGFPFTARTV